MAITLVEEYNSQWPSWLQRVVDALGSQVREACLRIEHVGSTSIPGMTAKPIVDLILVIEGSRLEEVKALLEARGYRHNGDQGITNREVFKIQDEDLKQTLPSHHLYVCPTDSQELRRETAFRDFLRTNIEYARALSELKWSLAERFNNDRQLYMDGKDAIYKEITEKALASLNR